MDDERIISRDPTRRLYDLARTGRAGDEMLAYQMGGQSASAQGGPSQAHWLPRVWLSQLLRDGADLHYQTNEGYTLAEVALSHGHLNIARALMRSGAVVSEDPEHLASIARQLARTTREPEKGSNLLTPSGLEVLGFLFDRGCPETALRGQPQEIQEQVMRHQQFLELSGKAEEHDEAKAPRLSQDDLAGIPGIEFESNDEASEPASEPSFSVSEDDFSTPSL